MNEALACGWGLYVTLLFHFRINIHSKKQYNLASIAQIAHRSCGNNRFRERSPRLKATFDETKKVGKSEFLGFLKYTLSFVRRTDQSLNSMCAHGVIIILCQYSYQYYV